MSHLIRDLAQGQHRFRTVLITSFPHSGGLAVDAKYSELGRRLSNSAWRPNYIVMADGAGRRHFIDKGNRHYAGLHVALADLEDAIRVLAAARMQRPADPLATDA